MRSTLGALRTPRFARLDAAKREKDTAPATPMLCHQVIAWIDEKKARIVGMEKDIEHILTLHAKCSDSQAADVGAPSADSAAFFPQVARVLDTADEILIVGPSDTKLRFAEYLNKNDHSIDPRVLGVETLPVPDDARLAGYAKLYFAAGGVAGTDGQSGLSDEPAPQLRECTRSWQIA